MISLKETTDNLNKCLEDYSEIPLFEVKQLSEILRNVGVNLAWLCQVRNDYYKEFQSVYFQSKGTSDASKKREAEMKVPELDLTRKLLKHFGDLQSDIRTQISLHKNN